MPHHLYGDSNVERFFPLVKERKTDPQIQATTYTKTTNAVLLHEALTHPTTAHSIIVIAALTNLLTSKYFDDYDKLVEHCTSVFRDVLLWVEEGRNALPGFAAQVCMLHRNLPDFVVSLLNTYHICVFLTLYPCCQNYSHPRYKPHI
jgi:hypothetical protein